MRLVEIDGYLLQKFIISGANKLSENKDYIDALNVFPVPDGDTGTNMSLTVMAAAKEVAKIDSPKVCDVAKALSSGSLRGARGNSGVILSQLFRGFSKALDGKETMNAQDIARAFNNGVDSAYKAVMKPKEGTILTVSRAISDKALEVSIDTDNIFKMMNEVIVYGNEVLAKTIDMLPELKQAGVVDAGGKGLLSIFEGGTFGNDTDYVELTPSSPSSINVPRTGVLNTADINIEFGYCTEFFINLEKNTDEIEQSLKDYLETIGDSIVVASDDDFIKVHVHTNNPGKVLQRALKIGSLDNIKIENMRSQHSNLIEFEEASIPKKELEPPKEFGFVAVSVGDGINSMFTQYGVDELITGGQTMNPSIDDLLNAVDKVNAKNVFVLPNNKNIILAAKQAKEVCETKNIVVIETRSVTEGFMAIANFLHTSTLEENETNMKACIKNALTGQITYAVRETQVDNIEIKENDILCILNDKINNVSKEVELGTKALIDDMVAKNDDISIITVYYGEDISEKVADDLESYLCETYCELDVEVIYGGQPLYYYIIAIE